jgi:para-aminobenzoate synthetase
VCRGDAIKSSPDFAHRFVRLFHVQVSPTQLRYGQTRNSTSLFGSLAALCRRAIPNCCIRIIRNDHLSFAQLVPHLTSFSAIIVGPGPGSPERVGDIGVVKDLWHVSDKISIPVFGVCLGLQSLSIQFGARLKRLRVVKHGQISRIYHNNIGLFEGVGHVDAVRYHSLHVELLEDGEIEQLAWADDGIENGRVVMAVKHRKKPFWAVQYHPESVCTKGGLEVLRNFWRLAQEWAELNNRRTSSWNEHTKAIFGRAWPPHQEFPQRPPRMKDVVGTAVLDVPNLSTTSICEMLGASQKSSPFVFLDSAAQPGRFSIIASLSSATPKITYFVGDNFVSVSKGDRTVTEPLDSRDIWSWLASFMLPKMAHRGSPDIPFWGGLVGYMSYELGVDSLPVCNKRRRDNGRHADVNLVFVHRSVVLDLVARKIYIQSLIPGDEWISSTLLLLQKVGRRTQSNTPLRVSARNAVAPQRPHVVLPSKSLYISRINQAKEYLYSGDSYELCLTAQSRISVPRQHCSKAEDTYSSWELYKTLRQKNPAPHSAYLRLGPTTLMSSSPERFLSFSRPPLRRCQLRPIKGTVHKTPGVDRTVAERLLAGSKKEVAENLMIVDLIRHDLHGVIGENVQVEKFCGVEEYETVWQLVSVIEGDFSLPSSGSKNARVVGDDQLGWEVLRKSLPPGE